MPFISEKEVENIKENYPVGTRIKLCFMDDPFPIAEGTVGVVKSVDDAGQLHTHWESGQTLAIIPGVDNFSVISRPH